jgi:hypothetical protein
MDVSDLRQRILRALDEARTKEAARRSEVDTAQRDYETFLEAIAVPLLKQAQSILKAERLNFTVHSPADGARLAADASAQTYLEFVLDSSGGRPQVLGRVSIARGSRVNVDEQPVAAGKAIADLGEDDVARFLVTEIPKLVARPKG